MATVNQKSVILKIRNQAEKKLVREATEEVTENIFLPAVEQMQSDFERHPVTREIEGGINAKNISRTLPGLKGGEGRNLTSFIGLEDPEGDIQNIRDHLEPGPNGPQIRYVRGSAKNRLRFDFLISPPDLESIYAATPMPWGDGLSWVDRIEKGIPGLSHFLNRFDIKASRSGGGIQVKGTLRKSGFQKTSYLSVIFKRFLYSVKGRRSLD